MVFPLLPFLVGAAVGAAVTYVLRDRLPEVPRRKGGVKVTGDLRPPEEGKDEAVGGEAAQPLHHPPDRG